MPAEHAADDAAAGCPAARRIPARHTVRRLVRILAAGALVASCAERDPAPRAAADPACDESAARRAVEGLGQALKHVSLSAPDSTAAREMHEAYGPYVTPDLLATWTAEPDRAPGRRVSSPWPERIEIRSVAETGEGACLVEGELIYLTSVEVVRGGAALREPITAQVREENGWRVSAYESTPALAEEPAEDAADVIRRYYDAIAARDFRTAYALWAGSGEASGQSYAEFAGGYAETASVEAEVGPPGRVDPAAGSRYVEVPVVVRATTSAGEEQRYEGTYTLRRSVVDGASEEQRRWRIASAEMVRVR